MEKTQEDVSFVLLQPQENSIDITWQYMLYYREEAGKFSCYIPHFNIYFSAADKDAMDKKSEAVTQMYMDHFVLHTKGGMRSLVMQLHKLGFKAKDDAITLKKILKDNVFSKTKFNSINNVVPGGFKGSKSIHHQKEFAL